MRPASFGVRAIEFATGSRAGSRNIGALCLDKLCIWLRDNSATGPKGSESLRRERSIDRAVARRSLVQIPKPPAPAARSVAVRSEGRGPLGNRTAITVSIMLATIMQGVDNTIANVALPHIQGSLSAAQDQIAWVLTSYIVAAAITMPLTGWLAGRFGIKYVFLISVGGFTFASALCGSATSPS
jgi:hypothetical protein